MWIKIHQFRESGFFRFLHSYRRFAQKCALFSPRDAPDFWCLALKLSYSTPKRRVLCWCTRHIQD